MQTKKEFGHFDDRPQGGYRISCHGDFKEKKNRFPFPFSMSACLEVKQMGGFLFPAVTSYRD